MINAVRQTLDRFRMLPNGGNVVAALSGGADSVTLLHILYSIKEEYQIQIHAAHLHHGIRGEEATRDEQFCKILCEKYNIPFHVRHADIPKLSQELKISEELCGRNERYRFLTELSEQLHARIATAHTASDNAETLLFNLTRGMSLTGASGIPPVRGNIIRPLLFCTREDVEDYCTANGLRYVTDSTNLTDNYTRNKIRHQIIPVLKEINPALEQAVSRFCESAASADAYLQAQAQQLLQQAHTAYGYAAPVLLQADNAVRTTALSQLCPVAPETRYLTLLQHCLQHGGTVDFGKCEAVCKQGVLRIVPKATIAPLQEIALHGTVHFSYQGKTVTASIQNSDNELNNLVFRTRRQGDRFTFCKRHLTKPLRKALNEQKIPAEQRDSMILLCRDSTVLWCEPLGYSQQGHALAASNGLHIHIF